jgi:hypothetical protein
VRRPLSESIFRARFCHRASRNDQAHAAFDSDVVRTIDSRVFAVDRRRSQASADRRRFLGEVWVNERG